MTFKEKLLKVKEANEYIPKLDECKENEPVVVADKQITDEKRNLICFVKQIINQYLYLQQLEKDIQILSKRKEISSNKLKVTLKCVEQTNRIAAKLEKKRELTSKLYNLYKYNLGLEIKLLKDDRQRENPEIKFSFHQVNKNKSEMECSFILMLIDDKYDVKLCKPPIKEIDKLLEKLNNTNDISSFVIEVRRNFCTL